MSALYHEGQAKAKAAAERREAKYGGEQQADTMVDLCEPSIPGVLMKKIVRPGNGELPPVGSMVSMRSCSLEFFTDGADNLLAMLAPFVVEQRR